MHDFALWQRVVIGVLRSQLLWLFGTDLAATGLQFFCLALCIPIDNMPLREDRSSSRRLLSPFSTRS